MNPNRIWISLAILVGIIWVGQLAQNFLSSPLEGFSAQSGGCGYSGTNNASNYGLYQDNSFFNNAQPYYYRNYGELTDPYYPNYWRNLWYDLPYYYYNRNSFDRYRKTWGSNDYNRCHKKPVNIQVSKCRKRRQRYKCL